MPSPFSEMGGVTSDVVVGSSRQQPPKKKPRQKAKGSANADVAASQLPAEGGSEVSQAYHQRYSVDSPPMDTKTTSVLLCAPSPQLTSRADLIGTPVPIPHRILARTVDTAEASATARVPPGSEGGACSMDATPEAIPLPLSSPAVLPMPPCRSFCPFHRMHKLSQPPFLHTRGNRTSRVVPGAKTPLAVWCLPASWQSLPLPWAPQGSRWSTPLGGPQNGPRRPHRRIGSRKPRRTLLLVRWL